MAELQVVVSQKPGKITSNFEEIKNTAITKTEALKGVIVTEDTVKDTKKDIAEFRGYQKEINARRIEAKKEFLKPFETFKNQCNEVIEILEKAISPMNNQVKEFDIAQKEEKKKKAHDYYLKKMGGQSETITFDEIYKDSWLNTSTSFKAIKEDIDTAVSNRLADLEAITAMKSEVEEKALITYKQTKRLSDALKIINDYEAQKKAILEREERRKREEEERKARVEKERLAREQRQREIAAEKERLAEIERIRAEEQAKVLESVKRAQEQAKRESTINGSAYKPAQEIEEFVPVQAVDEVAFPGNEEPDEIAFPADEEEIPFPAGDDNEEKEIDFVSVKAEDQEQLIFKKYLVKATKKQHDLIIQTLDGIGVHWSE